VSNTEHERKFLVRDRSILKGSIGNEIEQGYVWAANGWAIRARRTHIRDGTPEYREEAPAMITIKGPRVGSSRAEYNVAVEIDEAISLIYAADLRISKTRHPVVSEGLTWEVDVFHGQNQGLVIAEIEMTDAVTLASIKKPVWAGPEVTLDDRYANERLARNPWPTWPENQPRPPSSDR
jgi:adenylate cyclase